MIAAAAVFHVLVSVGLLTLILMHSGRDTGLGGMGFTPASQGGTHARLAAAGERPRRPPTRLAWPGVGGMFYPPTSGRHRGCGGLRRQGAAVRLARGVRKGGDGEGWGVGGVSGRGHRKSALRP